MARERVDWGYVLPDEGVTLKEWARSLAQNNTVATVARLVQERVEGLPESYRGSRKVSFGSLAFYWKLEGWRKGPLPKEQAAEQIRARQVPAELRVTADRVLITGDWHIPYTHKELYKRLLELAERERVRALIICGDFLDFEVFSDIPRLRRVEAVQEELETARRTLEVILERFDTIAWAMGNHEERFVRWARGALECDDMWRLVLDRIEDRERVKVTARHYVVLNESWRITHPGSYSRIAPQVERQLAARLGQNVLGWHGHLFGLSVDIGGRYVVGQLGGLVDPELVWYLARHDTTHPNWVPGFWYFREGTIYPMTLVRGLTDWGLWGFSK